MINHVSHRILIISHGDRDEDRECARRVLTASYHVLLSTRIESIYCTHNIITYCDMYIYGFVTRSHHNIIMYSLTNCRSDFRSSLCYIATQTRCSIVSWFPNMYTHVHVPERQQSLNSESAKIKFSPNLALLFFSNLARVQSGMVSAGISFKHRW